MNLLSYKVKRLKTDQNLRTYTIYIQCHYVVYTSEYATFSTYMYETLTNIKFALLQ